MTETALLALSTIIHDRWHVFPSHAICLLHDVFFADFRSLCTINVSTSNAKEPIPNYPGVFSKQFIPGGVIITPLKIHHINEFCFYRGLDMYLKG